jgi:hypothetical protein
MFRVVLSIYLKRTYILTLLTAGLSLVAAGCKDSSAPKPQAPAPDTKAAAEPAGQPEDEAAIRANLEKLSPEDRKLVEAQRFCVIQDEERLGEMGTPVKVMVKGQPVFLCCKSCRKKALADPDKTLAKAKQLKEKAARSPRQ